MSKRSDAKKYKFVSVGQSIQHLNFHYDVKYVTRSQSFIAEVTSTFKEYFVNELNPIHKYEGQYRAIMKAYISSEGETSFFQNKFTTEFPLRIPRDLDREKDDEERAFRKFFYTKKRQIIPNREGYWVDLGSDTAKLYADKVEPLAYYLRAICDIFPYNYPDKRPAVYPKAFEKYKTPESILEEDFEYTWYYEDIKRWKREHPNGEESNTNE